MSDPVRLSGFFSTFDTESVIAQITNLRMAKVTQLEIQSAKATAKKGAIGTVQTAVNALLTKLGALSNASSVSGKSAVSSGSAVSVGSTPSSTLGSFTVDVTRLASASRMGGTPFSAGIDTTKSMNESNFGTVPTNGTFTISTATGGAHTFGIGGGTAQSTALLSASNFQQAVTSGNFTIATATGGPATIAVDIATQSLDDIVTAINASGIGVTATITADQHGHLNQLSIVSTQGDITMGAPTDTSNFLSATNLYSAPGTTTKTSSAAFTKQMTLDEVILDINASAIGVIASITNDTEGRPNILTVTSSQGNISFGNGGDSSNFLSATGLLTSASGATRSSANPLARLSLSANMDAAGFNGGAPAAGDHTVTINGIDIAYNAATDSISDVISRINASAAGVTARYDSLSDTIKLQNTRTGPLSITVEDDFTGGDLAAKFGLIGAATTAGENAEYSIDGGPPQGAASNTVSYNGVTLTLSSLTSGTPVTVTVSQDSTSALNAVKGFVAEFNNVLKAIDTATKADGSKTNNTSGPLSGDASLRQLKSDIRSMVTGMGINIEGTFTTLSQIGISFGAVGSAIGTTNTLQLDETKFKDALAADPSGTQSLLSALTLDGSLAPGGTGSITGLTGTYTGSLAGRYNITDDGLGTLTSVFTPANGGPPTTTVANVLAGGSTTLLVQGMTIAIGAHQAGTHTINVSPSSQSVVQRLKQFAEVQAGAGGVLQKRQDAFDKINTDITERIDIVIERIEKEMEVLRQKFARMEQAQAQAQGIMSTLTQMSSRLAAESQ